MKFDDSGSKKREKYDFGVIFEVPGPENLQKSGNFGFFRSGGSGGAVAPSGKTDFERNFLTAIRSE